MLMITSITVQKKDDVTQKQKALVKIFKWSHENSPKVNQEECHFLLILDINTKFSLPACILENSNSQKRVGVTIDRRVNFNKYFTNICHKTSKEIQALPKVFPYIPQIQTRLLMNVYFMSQFGYCPLVWMNHSRTLNNNINGLHKRAVQYTTTSHLFFQNF